LKGEITVLKSIAVHLSTDLRRQCHGRRTPQTSFGLWRAARLATDLTLIQTVFDPGQRLSLNYGSSFSRFFKDGLGNGEYLLGMLDGRQRVASNILLLPDDHIGMRLIVGGDEVLVVEFEMRTGNIVKISAKWSLMGNSGWRNISINHCYFCGAETVPDHGRYEHRDHCPHDVAEHLPRRTDWSSGFQDGYNGLEMRGGSAEYRLGHDMGGLAYQADIAMGCTQPFLCG
jgi:hypothetical protein